MPLLSLYGPVSPQCGIELLFTTASHAVEQGMEFGGVVLVNCVAQLMENHEIDKLIRQTHQKDRKGDVVICRTTAPACA